ncbi:GGDEF domain-containing protein [Salinispirillum marinum]|uniref:diguanylate cyclase n=2 Tax=Saccharospirillaceae TaxID=255527 RepID=A0ABV8BE70_9GAMM
MTSIHTEHFPRKVSILFHVVAILPLGGFMLYHGVWGSVTLGVFLGIALATVALSLLQELRHKDSLPFRQMFVLTCSAAIVYACYQVGLRGLIYSFPMASVFFFTFTLRQGILTGTVFSIACLVAAANVEPTMLVLRFAIGVTISMVFAAIFAFIVERQKFELAEQAATDTLTGALNRKRLAETLERAIHLSARSEVPDTLLLLDLDHFKTVNDRKGHLAGDAVLVQFTQLVQERIRASDQLFRFGGEEFLLLLPQTAQAEAFALAESLREKIASELSVDDMAVTCSIGVSQWRPGDTVESWLKSCDVVLYAAKDQGRNTTVARPVAA